MHTKVLIINSNISNSYLSVQTEDEIATLRQVLSARMKHSSELKHKLGLSPWTELTTDLKIGITSVKESNALVSFYCLW